MAPVAFASTYPPRRCGIATFTADLAKAMGGHAIVALRHPDEAPHDDPSVHRTLHTDVATDFATIAHSLDDSGVGIVSVQHEYGIWGPNDGAGVLDFLSALSVPAVATLHTVLRHPSVAQRDIMLGILESTAAVVVMSKAAETVLTDRYGADPNRVVVIPHGVPDLPYVESDRAKPAVGLQGRSVVLSFGLLGPGKGYETVIEAMSTVVQAVPDACYVIVGETHPGVVRTEGERYRSRLESLAAELGMSEQVVFVDRFVELGELGRWLASADVCVTPYPNLEQIVSGTLAYAVAAGKAAISTPYPYATEVLADGRGVLVQARDATAMADALVTLLQDRELRTAMGRRAYRYGRGMTWSNVAYRYERLFARLEKPTPDADALPVFAIPTGVG